MTPYRHLHLVRPGDVEHTSYGRALAGEPLGDGAPVIRSVPLRCSRCYARLPVVGHEADGSLLSPPGHVCERMPWAAPWLDRAIGVVAFVTLCVLVALWLVR
jgi:hypothetical protein